MTSKHFRPVPPVWAVLLCAAVLALSAAVAGAQGRVSAVAPLHGSLPGPLVVRNDRGGRIAPRAAEVAALRASGRAVEIRGEVCLSSCTLYLALPQVCVDPRTTFGFHGPSHHGRKLSDRDFAYWSELIAAHYPKALAAWYLREGRNTISGYHRIKGAELIRLGLRACVTPA